MNDFLSLVLASSFLGVLCGCLILLVICTVLRSDKVLFFVRVEIMLGWRIKNQ